MYRVKYRIYTQKEFAMFDLTATNYDFNLVSCAGVPTVVPSQEPEDDYLDLEEMGLTPPDEGDWVRYENEF